MSNNEGEKRQRGNSFSKSSKINSQIKKDRRLSEGHQNRTQIKLKTNEEDTLNFKTEEKGNEILENSSIIYTLESINRSNEEKNIKIENDEIKGGSVAAIVLWIINNQGMIFLKMVVYFLQQINKH